MHGDRCAGGKGGPPWARHFGHGFGPPRGFGMGGPPFGPPFGGPPFGRRRRMRRGNLRIAILALLRDQPMHGYQVMQELAARSGERWRPSPGSVYPTLQQLQDEGLVRSEEAEGRKVFELTDAGRAHIEERAEEFAEPWEGLAGDEDDDALELRDLTFQVGAAVMQVAQVGTKDVIDEARQILSETRRRLYRLLAEDDPGREEKPEA